MSTVSRMTHGPTNQRDYYGTRACPRCNHIYRAALNIDRDEVCPTCKKTEEKEDRRKRLGFRENASGNAFWWTVVADPSGEFRVGAKFEAGDFRESEKMGNWPVGMVFKFKSHLYQIDNGGNARWIGKADD